MRRLFIHIPKCGGMTVRRGCKEQIIVAERKNLPQIYAQLVWNTMSAAGEHHGFEHARWRDVDANVRERHQAFAMTRNPWARVVSRYTFAQHCGDPSGKQKFQDFLEERHKYGGLQYYWHRAIRGWYNQVDYVTNELGELQCDMLRLGTGDLERYFGFSKLRKIRNISNRGKDYRRFYNHDTFGIVAEWYARDIEFFGYSFDSDATRNVWKPTS